MDTVTQFIAQEHFSGCVNLFPNPCGRINCVPTIMVVTPP